VAEVVRRPPPPAAGPPRSRWTLAGLRQAVAWLGALSLGGASKVLRRLGVRYRRGQEHVHSPDPEYDAKLAAVAAARAEAAASGGRVAFLYEDELTYYRKPAVARAYAPAGGPGARAEQGLGKNRKRRLIGALDAGSGRLFCWQRSDARRANLIRYYEALQAAYPKARAIYVAQDNWSVHFHPDVLAALAGSKIRLLRLPTYAPWTNPIEKAWRKLKQEVLYMHPFADDWAGLQAAVQAWVDRHDRSCPDLLRYAGLDPE
jgi:transposase